MSALSGAYAAFTAEDAAVNKFLFDHGMITGSDWAGYMRASYDDAFGINISMYLRECAGGPRIAEAIKGYIKIELENNG